MPSLDDRNAPAAPLEQKSRQFLTFMIISLSVVGVLALCITVICLAEQAERLETAKLVFSAALPLLASWVGTILAYYFSKDNFLAATQSVTQLARTVSAMEKLRSLSVAEAMRPLVDMKIVSVPSGTEERVKLSDLVAHFPNVDRLVVVQSDGSPVINWLIYKSAIHEYISDTAQARKPFPAGKSAVGDLTLNDLVENSDKKELFKKSFGFVSARATLAEVKAVMDSIPLCSDVFVTQNGKPTESILGWVTDNKINDHARVD